MCYSLSCRVAAVYGLRVKIKYKSGILTLYKLDVRSENLCRCHVLGSQTILRSKIELFIIDGHQGNPETLDD